MTAPRLAMGVWVLTCWLPSSARAQTQPSEQLAAAESALAHRDLDRAVQLATAYTGRRAEDPRGWMVLGKARLERSSGSAEHRLQAIWAFRRVVAAEPANREAWDLMAQAALLLGGADGERITAEASERLLALEPSDPVAWANWLKLYRGRGERERMRRVLAAHLQLPEARARIARLLIEDERYDSANVVLDALLRDDPMSPAYLALRAQSAFEAGDTASGGQSYARALRFAARDEGGVLWSQVIGIASPEEIRTWERGIVPPQREGFLWSFWARRNSNLFAGATARIAEHFTRLRYARKTYPLLHPLGAYQRNDTTRAAEIRPSTAENVFYLQCEAQDRSNGVMRATDRARTPVEAQDAAARELSPQAAHEATPSVPTSAWIPSERAIRDAHGIQIPGEYFLDPAGGLRIFANPFPRSVLDVDTTAARVGYNLRTGLDDRGITYLRFGAPRRRVIGSSNAEQTFCRVPDLERWDYPDIGPVRFFRPSAVDIGISGGTRQTGDMLFRPQNAAQFGATAASLTRDATAVAAPLEFGVWLAQFANRGEPSQTDVAVFATRNVLAAQLAAAFAEPAPPETDSLGLVVLTAAPGGYVLQAHVQAGDSLGRLERTALVRNFGAGHTLSDLLVAPSWGDTLFNRATILARTPRELTFPTGGTIRSYAEVYGMPRSPEGTVRYRVSYQLVRTSNLERDFRRDSLAGGTTFHFDRERRYAGRTTIEWLDITPELVPPGQYLLRLTIGEASGGRLIGRAQIAFEIR
jgi:tetratricopeptide (TPR) repeat protein